LIFIFKFFFDGNLDCLKLTLDPSIN